jgi:hypothetical protein
MASGRIWFSETEWKLYRFHEMSNQPVLRVRTIPHPILGMLKSSKTD